MTMISNDERREVASNLRKMVEEKNGIYNALDASPFANICSGLLIEYKVGANDYIHCCDVMLRIADLIEPEERTCRYKHIEGTWYRSSCGERYDGVVPPNYCPNCGAKVIGG